MDNNPIRIHVGKCNMQRSDWAECAMEIVASEGDSTDDIVVRLHLSDKEVMELYTASIKVFTSKSVWPD